MIGDNELRLNEATLIAAVQEYLAARMSTQTVPKVTGVMADNSLGVFIVKLQGPGAPSGSA